MDEIKEVLKFVMVKVGLRSQNWPNDLEKIVLVDHIQENFGGHHLTEIKLAFDLAIARKIEVEVNCYENFSCLYFTNIMLAYRRWSSEAYQNNLRQIQKPEAKELPYIFNPKKEIEELIELYVDDCRKGRLKIEFVMPSLFDKMIEHEIIDSLELDTLTAKRDFVYEYIINKSRA